MKNVFYLMLAVLFITACSKDQKAVKNLEGTWARANYTEAGVTMTDTSNTTYEFTTCKVKKEDCPGKLNSDGKTLDFTYNFTDKGEKFNLFIDFLGVVSATKGDVVEQTDNKFVFSYTNDSGVLVQETLTK